MAKVKTGSEEKPMRPGLTPEARENQLINLAVDLAEKQLRDGTASSQVTTHFLKLATVKAQLENEKLKKENALLEAKKEALESQKKVEELYLEAITAFKNYGGQGDPDDYADLH